MICYEVITRKEVFRDAQASSDVVRNVIAESGRKPNMEPIESVQKTLEQQQLVIFQKIIDVMEKCWSFKPEDRYTTEQRKYRFSFCFDIHSETSVFIFFCLLFCLFVEVDQNVFLFFP